MTGYAPPVKHATNTIVSRQQALDAMRRASEQDVEKGGIYDARSAAINIWSYAWDTPESRLASELVGTIYLDWHTPHDELATIRQLDVEQGWELADVEKHVALLFGP
jgi:hypothetical protein